MCWLHVFVTVSHRFPGRNVEHAAGVSSVMVDCSGSIPKASSIWVSTWLGQGDWGFPLQECSEQRFILGPRAKKGNTARWR